MGRTATRMSGARRTVGVSPPTAATTPSQRTRPTRPPRPATTWPSPGAGRRAWLSPPRIPAAGRSGQRFGRRALARLMLAGALPRPRRRAAPRSRGLRATRARRARRPSCKIRPPVPCWPRTGPHRSWEWSDSSPCPPGGTQMKASRAKCPESRFHEVSSVPFNYRGVCVCVCV